MNRINPKILNTFSPIISCFPEYGNLFSVLDVNDPNISSWICMNFLHINSQEDRYLMFKDQWSVFKTCPFLERKAYINLYTNMTQLIDFIINSLDSGYYIMLYLNCKYISQLGCEEDLNHLTFIYGYDKNTQHFYISDNIDNGKYFRTKYSFSEIFNAYQNLTPVDGWSDLYNILSFKQGYSESLYYFDINKMAKELLLFLTPFWLTFNNKCYKPTTAYNLEAIDLEIQKLKIDYTLRRDHVNLIRYCVYRDHIKMLNQKLSFLERNGYLRNYDSLIKKYAILKQHIDLVINLSLKFKASHDFSKLLSVINYLCDCIVIENTFIKLLLDDIIKTNNLVLDLNSSSLTQDL